MNQIFIQAGKFMRNNSTTILTVAGVVGVVGTAAMATNATTKAVKVLAEAEEMYNRGNYPKVTRVEAVKLTWKYYVPTFVMGGLTIASIISSNRISMKQSAAIASALTLTDTAFREYRTAVSNNVTPKKFEAIKDTVARNAIEKNPSSSEAIILTGETLCYDKIAGRYFKSDIEKIRRVINDLNSTMMNTDMYVALNDFYYGLGLPQVSAGDVLGWNVDNGIIEPTFSSQLTTDGAPCLVIDFVAEPIANYM